MSLFTKETKPVIIEVDKHLYMNTLFDKLERHAVKNQLPVEDIVVLIKETFDELYGPND